MTIHHRERRLAACLLAGVFVLALPAVVHAQTAPNTGPPCTGDDAAGTTQCGTGSSASAPLATAVGNNAAASGPEATAYGSTSNAAADSSTAVGAEAHASGTAASAFGGAAFAQGQASTAAGIFAYTPGSGAVAVGAIAYAQDAGGVAIGQLSDARGTDAIAIGGNSQYDPLSNTGSSPTTGTLGAYANGVGSVVVGGQARVGKDNDAVPNDLSPGTPANYGTAIGFRTVVEADGGTAIGANARASQVGATAIGFGAVTTAANQVTLGGAGSSVRIGDIAASTAAQAGATAVMTVDASGTVGADPTIRPAISALQSGQAAMQGQIRNLYDLNAATRRDLGKVTEGVAMALAMERPSLPPGTRFGLAGGFGYYNDRTAGAASFAFRITEHSSVSGGVGFGMSTGEVGARAGFQAAW